MSKNSKKVNRGWYFAETKEKSKVAELYIYGVIGFDPDAKSFSEEMKAIQGKDLSVYINSPGGSVFDGMAIVNQIERHEGKVTAYVDGLAASAASFILTAADEVYIAENASVMIHNCWSMAL